MRKLAITDIKIPDACTESLKNFGFEIIKLPPFSRLPSPVSSHPDMLMCIVGNKIVTHKEYFEENRRIFDLISSASKKEIITSDDTVRDSYPSDISLDALLIGNFFFSLTEHTSRALIDEAKRIGYNTLNVNQGYAKCSVCPVSEGAAITSDPSLAEAMEKQTIDVLRISSGGIKLEPYDYGFIGGASGYDNERVYFCGSIEQHPDANSIIEFFQKHGKVPISLSNEPLVDVGTIFIL